MWPCRAKRVSGRSSKNAAPGSEEQRAWLRSAHGRGSPAS